MAIEVELPDGTIAEFPDGTDNATMERALAQYVSKAAAPDFKSMDIRSSVDSTAPLKPKPRTEKPLQQFDQSSQPQYRPTLGPRRAPEKKASERSRLGQIETGADVAGRRAARGISQLLAIGADAVAPRERDLAGLITGRDNSRLAGLQRLETQRRAEEGARMDTGLSRGARVGAEFGMLLLPGTKIGSASTLGRLATGTVTGAALGAASPTTPEESRGVNTLAGGAGGLVGGAVAPVIGRGINFLARPLQAFTQRGADRQAANLLLRGASDPTALSKTAPSAVPGVTRTLAEETLDPGIAQLQRQFPTELAELARSNNAARVAHLENAFGGADPAASAAIRDRASGAASQAARQLRNTKVAPDLEPVNKLLDRMTDHFRGRPAVQQTLAYVRELTKVPPRNAEDAWNVRKTIGDLMEGKIGGEQASSRVARQQLRTVQYALDRQMNRAFPQWRQFLKDYKGMQREADQVDVGVELLRRGGVEGLDATGAPVRALQPGRFRNLTDNPDMLVRSATGFNKARADQVLTPEQMKAVGAVRDDVVHSVEAQNLGRAVGSPTKQNLDTGAMLSDAAARSRLGAIVRGAPIIGTISENVSRAAEARVRMRLAAMLASPTQARAALQAAPADERRIIEAVLSQVGAASGSQIGVAVGQ